MSDPTVLVQSPPLLAAAPAPRGVVVYGGDTLVPDAWQGWPDALSAVLAARRAPYRGPVLNLGQRGARGPLGFADVVRAACADPSDLTDRVAVIALAHTDGRSDRLSPSEATAFTRLALDGLWRRGAAHVLVVGPTGGGVKPGKQPAARYGSYARWLRRVDKAVRAEVGVGDAASYVSLADLPLDLTRDGVHPSAAGWRWVAERVADVLVGDGVK